MYAFHLVLGRPLDRFPGQDYVASRNYHPIIPRTFGSHGRTILDNISLIGEVARHSGLCEFHSCTLCREMSRRVLFAKIHLCHLHLG